MAQLPPPIHGAALRNQSILESKYINDFFEIRAHPLFFANQIKDIGKFSFHKLYLTFKYCLRLIFLLGRNRVDLAYFTFSPNGFAFYRDILIITILKIFKVPRLYHFRIKGLQRTARSFWGKQLIKYALRNAQIICLSKHHLEDLKGFSIKRFYIVPNGIRIEQITFQEEKMNTPPQILMISNLAKSKGVFDLIEALEILNKKGVTFKAQIIGAEHDITFDKISRLLFEKGLKEKVLVPGPKFGFDKFKVLEEADIFVFPTCFELFPGVILEAMQFGKAIIASLEGSIPEIIDEGKDGFLVPKQNPHLLADRIEKLLSNKEMRDIFGKNAQAKFFNNYTMEIFEKNMKAALEKALSESNRTQNC